MKQEFSSTLAPLSGHLGELREALTFLRDATRVQSVLGKVVKWELGKTYETQLTDAFHRRSPLDARPIRNGLFVTAVAAFEEFLRAVISLAVRSRCESVDRLSSLGEPFMKRHIQYSGRLLATIQSPPAHLAIDYFEVCRRLGTCMPDVDSFEVNDIALTLVQGLTELDAFFDCLSPLGYDLSWDDLGRRTEIKKLLGASTTRNAAKDLQVAIGRIVRERNRVAHSGQSYADITDEHLEQNLQLLEVTASAIVEHLASQVPKAKAQ